MFFWCYYSRTEHGILRMKLYIKKAFLVSPKHWLWLHCDTESKIEQKCVSIKREFMRRWLVKRCLFTYSNMNAYVCVKYAILLNFLYFCEWMFACICASHTVQLLFLLCFTHVFTDNIYWRKIETKLKQYTVVRWYNVTSNEHVKQMILWFMRSVMHRYFVQLFTSLFLCFFRFFLCLSQKKKKKLNGKL